jgi:asparagine synthase (glutamine-hydrolysing)
MCGVAAIFSCDGQVGPVETKMATMLAHMRWRGPDHSTWHTWPECSLGSSRLRIQDLRACADQPMSGPLERAHVSFNGEIFNHLKLREGLERPARGWMTRCDTETLIAGYEQCGESIVERLEGQFAFAIFDQARRQLVLARDRFGICPLYFAQMGRTVVAASSVLAILKAFVGKFSRVDRAALQQYLLLRYTVAPHTIVDGIRQVGPGEIVLFRDGAMRTRRYWTIPNARYSRSAAHNAVPELVAAIETAVSDNCLADAEVGVFLSGGIDSSVVGALASRQLPAGTTAVTISFAGTPDDEGDAAAGLADQLGFRHVRAVVTEEDSTELIQSSVDALDVPCGARDTVATDLLAATLRRASPDCKVVLTGTGADELFGGYRGTYFGATEGRLTDQIAHYLTLYSAVQENERQVLRTLLPDLDEAALVDALTARATSLFPAIDASDSGRVLDLFYLITHLPGWELSVNDMMCMRWSLEARVPLLHSAVASVAMQLPSAWTSEPGSEKAALRNAARRWLTDAVCFRPKLPLSRPVGAWLGRSRLGADWRPAVLADIGFDSGALDCALARKPSFDLWWRLFLLDRWVERHLNG